MRAFALTFLAASIFTAIMLAADPKNSLDGMNVPETGTFSRQTPRGQTLRIVTWNIDRGYHTDEVAATLSKQDAQLCLLQEVDKGDRRTSGRNVGEKLASEGGYNYAFGTAFQELSQSVDEAPAYQGQATLSRWPITGARLLRFQNQSSWWQPHAWIPDSPFFQRRLGGRIALITEIAVHGQTIVVYNLHLESRSGGTIQSAQLDEVFKDLEKYPAGSPAIIGGDFNSKYHPYELLHSMEQRGFKSVLGERVERTHVIIGYLDWIFYRGPWQLTSGAVLRGTHASDHDAVMGVLTKRESPSN
jgi:endonuclease/exonuclease/phosphatase family metal-dependent hydrolase